MKTQAWNQVHALIGQAIRDEVFPGAAWGVTQGGHVLQAAAAGRHTYAPHSPPATPATLWDLASVSKVVATTTMAMQLWERGQLELSMPVGDVLPGFAVGGKHRVHVEHLLAHSSGLPGYRRLYERCRTPGELMAACLAMELEAPPGTRAEYSDIGFIVLGKLLEQVAGEPLPSWCEREIFAPLGMDHTLYRPAPALCENCPPTELDREAARGYAQVPGGVVQGVVHDENCAVLGGAAGHAGLFAPLGDVLRFAAGLTTGRLVKPSTLARWTQPVLQPAGSTRALGWDTPSPEGSSAGALMSRRSFGHLGYTGTSLWVDPERRVAIALLTNRTWPTRTNERIRGFRPLFHNAVLHALGAGE